MTGEAANVDQERRNSQGTGRADKAFEDPGLSFGDLFRTLLKHKWFILACVIVGLGISAVYAKLATRIYEASAVLRIDPARASSLGLNAPPSTAIVDPLRTEAEIIKSDAVIMSALNSLSEEQFYELTGTVRSEMEFPASLISTTAPPEQRLSGETPMLSSAQENLIALVKGELSVVPVGDSELLRISVQNPNPEAAATLTNRIAAAYLRNSFDDRYSSVTQVQTWLSEQLNNLKQRATESQKRLADFQEKNNIVGPAATENSSSNNTVLDRLRQLNDRVTSAQADRLVKEAQLKAAQTGDVGTLATLYPNVGLQSLQSQQAVLYGRYAELSAKFGPHYPPLAEVIQERKSVEDQIQRLIETTRNRLRQDYQISKNTEDLLRQQYNEQTQAVFALNSKQAEYAVLIAESSASRSLYDRLQYELEQASVTAGLSAVNTVMVTSARVPHFPVLPKKTLILAFGLILGLFTGAAASFLVEIAKDRMQSVVQTESNLQLPVLATIPRDARLQNRGRNAGLLPLTFRESFSKTAEAFRALRNAVFFSPAGHSGSVTLVCSTLGDEGASMLAANYGVVLAQSGARVLVVDTDLRRPTLHSLFNLENGTGFSDALNGGPEAARSFQHPIAEIPNLTVLTAGKNIDLPAEALASTKMQHMIGSWRTEFDFVVFDAAPLLVVTDALPIARVADTVLLVARYDITPMGAAKKATDLLRRAHISVTGVVLTDVPSKGLDYSSYVDKGYYRDLRA